MSALDTHNVSFINDLLELPEGMRNVTELRALNTLSFQCYSKDTTMLDELSSRNDFDAVDISHDGSLATRLHSLSMLSSLYWLDISHCTLPSMLALPADISKLATLRILSLDHLNNMISLPEGLSELIALKMLFISNCKDLVSLPEGISKLIALERLSVTSAKRLQRLPRGISAMCGLQSLCCIGCEVLQDIPEQISALGALTELVHLQQHSGDQRANCT